MNRTDRMTVQKKVSRSPHPTPEDLRAAYSENWGQLRHLDTQRFFLLNLQLVATAGIAALLVNKADTVSVSTCLLLSLTLGMLSFLVFLVLLKLSSDLANNWRTLQWAAERMRLIEELKNTETDFAKDAMFRGFGGLALPIRLRLPRVGGAGIGTMDALFSFLPMVTTSVAVGLSAYWLRNEFNWMSWVSDWEAAAIAVLAILPLEGIRHWYGYRRELILGQRKPPDIMISHTDEASGGKESFLDVDGRPWFFWTWTLVATIGIVLLRLSLVPLWGSALILIAVLLLLHSLDWARYRQRSSAKSRGQIQSQKMA